MKGSPEREEEKISVLRRLEVFNKAARDCKQESGLKHSSAAEDDDNADQKSINSRDDGGAALMGRAP